jgi:hypothetical protein
MEARANAAGLGVVGFGPGVLGVVNDQIELVIMSLRLPTILGPSVCQDTDQAMPCYAKKGSTRQLGRSAPVIGVLVV